ncbi:hypothetical protein [Campylobacter cuniculorum]|uniref:hypothetical protein n=1 Tax=Campylobacter cuniculorum TaxID=374106 RepID=UPI0023F59017|nr:hypothetical protein [Campylobacter cuniculorum]
MIKQKDIKLKHIAKQARKAIIFNRIKGLCLYFLAYPFVLFLFLLTLFIILPLLKLFSYFQGESFEADELNLYTFCKDFLSKETFLSAFYAVGLTFQCKECKSKVSYAVSSLTDEEECPLFKWYPLCADCFFNKSLKK